MILLLFIVAAQLTTPALFFSINCKSVGLDTVIVGGNILNVILVGVLPVCLAS